MLTSLLTGWERTVHMTYCPICIGEKSLPFVMTIRMCLRELCFLFEIFYYLDLNHLVKVVHLFMLLLLLLFG